MVLLLTATPQLGAATERVGQTRQAITRAVDFLAQAQQPDGSFLIYRCQDEAFTDCRPFYSIPSMEKVPNAPILSSAATAVVLNGLMAVEGPRAEALVERGARWLQAQMDEEGMFGSYRMVEPQEGPQCVGEFRQLYATTVNRSVLESRDASLPPILPTLTSYQRHDGTFYPLLGFRHHFSAEDAEAIAAGGPAQGWFSQRYELLMQTYETPMLHTLDVVEPVLNALTFNYLTRHGQVSAELCGYLVQVAQADEIAAPTAAFVDSPYVFAYALSQAYRHGATCVEPAKTALQPRLLSQQRPDGTWGNVIDTAVAANALMGFGYEGEALDRAIQSLLDQQQADGSWARAAWVTAQWKPVWRVSEELSTGYVLEALGNYLKVRQTSTL